MKITKYTIITTALISALTLGGCAATDELSKVTNKVTNKLTGNEEALTQEADMAQIAELSNINPEEWINEPLFGTTSCNSLNFSDFSGMIMKYQAPAILNDGEAADSGKRTVLMYSMSSALVNRSMLCMSQALELKETTDTLMKEREILMSGTSLSKDQIEKHRELSKSASEQLKTAAEKIDSITPEKREDVIIGISTYLAGIYSTYRTADSMLDYAKDSKDVVTGSSTSLSGLFNKVKNVVGSAQTMYDVTSGMPDHVSNLYDTGTFLYKYAKQENLELPADATEDFMNIDISSMI